MIKHFLRHRLEQVAGGINLFVKANKTEFMYFKAISTLNGKPLKFVDQFTYLGSNISSTENDVNISLVKAWRLSINWKSDLSDKIKRDFFQAVVVSILIYGCANEMHGEKARWKLYKNVSYCFEQIMEATLHKTAAVRPLTSYLTTHSSKTNKTCRGLLEN